MRQPELEHVQTGDQIILHRGWAPPGIPENSLETVTHATKTQILLGDTRFRRRDGKPVGSGYYDRGKWIEPATPEAIERMHAANEYNRRERRRNTLYRAIRDAKIKGLELEALEDIYETLVTYGAIALPDKETE